MCALVCAHAHTRVCVCVRCGERGEERGELFTIFKIDFVQPDEAQSFHEDDSSQQNSSSSRSDIVHTTYLILWLYC